MFNESIPNTRNYSFKKRIQLPAPRFMISSLIICRSLIINNNRTRSSLLSDYEIVPLSNPGNAILFFFFYWTDDPQLDVEVRDSILLFTRFRFVSRFLFDKRSIWRISSYANRKHFYYNLEWKNFLFVNHASAGNCDARLIDPSIKMRDIKWMEKFDIEQSVGNVVQIFNKTYLFFITFYCQHVKHVFQLFWQIQLFL